MSSSTFQAGSAVDLRAVEHEYEGKAYRIGGLIMNRPRPSAWLPPARDSYLQAAAAVAQARNSSPAAAALLVGVAESFAAIGQAYEELAR